MEYNKDESIRCLERSEELLTKGDIEKALKFARKSNNLYPSPQAKGERIRVYGRVCACMYGRVCVWQG